MPVNNLLPKIIPLNQRFDANITIQLSRRLIGDPQQVQKYILKSDDGYHHPRVNIFDYYPMNLLGNHS